ncbi:PREDICTED: mitotic spindle assembly checkpoint protein MAD2B-like [Ceratosolen solmsi marchali]|uniref:Mitotic spindle assembly checkpoint protein MAD2B-like n=1 Tax=Ceratosolen solmsi marchali TaxID=326594 RepID=A0AAJ6YSE3_9HYME|nr:PREDICTED: mitotic spindle assembly checkpoint protein MAD2B-like [Ceratosolen solmsi marchali]
MRYAFDTDILLEFLEIAIHNILYYRNLYPKEAYIKIQIYGIYVYISQHPELNNYIKNTLICVKELVQENKNHLNSINLLYVNELNIPIEKFVFYFNQLEISPSKTDPCFKRPEEVLKNLCLNLSMLEICLKPLPINSSFYINIITNCITHLVIAENSKSYNFPWTIDYDFKKMESGLLLPINNFKVDCFELQLVVIEN